MISVKLENIEQLLRSYGKVADTVRKEMKDALDRSAAVVESTAKRLTPVDKGHLRRSIQKPRRVRAGDKTTAVGSNVKYAMPVHEITRNRHTVGEAKFLEKALKRNETQIRKFFKQMIDNILNKLAKYR